jgi:hypothetical protein
MSDRREFHVPRQNRFGGAVALVIGCVLLASGASSAMAHGTTTVVSVPGNQAWTDTGIALTTGQTVEIKPSGTIKWGFEPSNIGGPVGFTFGQALPGDEPNTCGSLSYTAEKAGEEFPLKGANCYAMLFRIGNPGKPFPTGKKITFESPVAGELFLGVNDQHLGDNSGAWTAKITTP